MFLLFYGPNKGTFLAKSKASLIGRQSTMSCQFRIPLQSAKHSRFFFRGLTISQLIGYLILALRYPTSEFRIPRVREDFENIKIETEWIDSNLLIKPSLYPFKNNSIRKITTTAPRYLDHF